MSREHNGIHNPNKPPMPEIDSETKKRNFGSKALACTGVVVAFAAINFGLPKALNKAADSVYEKGGFSGGMYFPNANDAVFECSAYGSVIKSEIVDYGIDEMGEEIGEVLEQENYGHQDGACKDGQLTPGDGDFWNSKVSEWGLAGLIFK